MTPLVMAAALAATDTCTVSGRVVDAFTGEALGGVEVRGGREVTRTVAGGFSLELACAPRIELVFDRLDYEPATRSLKLEGDATLDVALEPRQVSRIEDVIVEAPAPEKKPKKKREPKSLDLKASDRTEWKASQVHIGAWAGARPRETPFRARFPLHRTTSIRCSPWPPAPRTTSGRRRPRPTWRGAGA